MPQGFFVYRASAGVLTSTRFFAFTWSAYGKVFGVRAGLKLVYKVPAYGKRKGGVVFGLFNKRQSKFYITPCNKIHLPAGAGIYILVQRLHLENKGSVGRSSIVIIDIA